MSSFIQTTQQATTDIQQKTNKFMSQLKTHTFFIFYSCVQQKDKNLSLMEKLDFKLRDEKKQSTHQQTKHIQIKFYDINVQNDILMAISDVRSHSFQNKAKIIINASQEKLGQLIEQFQTMNVDISSIPIMINSKQYQSDISTFLGWTNKNKHMMVLQNLQYYKQASKQWIQAATQKIDLWQATIQVQPQSGRILRQSNNKLQQMPLKQLKQFFISHICLGHHASLLMNCKERIKSLENSLSNSLITTFQRWKKFCCVGNKEMRKTTGIANLILKDQKGQQVEIFKCLKPGDSEDESQVDFKTNKYKSPNQDILSILITNLNVYQGNPLEMSVEGKISDGKLEIITFQSQKNHRKICSSPGQIRIKLEAEFVDLQIGESVYRLEHPIQIKICLVKKIKIGIHSQLVRC